MSKPAPATESHSDSGSIRGLFGGASSGEGASRAAAGAAPRHLRLLGSRLGLGFVVGLLVVGPVLAFFTWRSASRYHDLETQAALADALGDRAREVEGHLLELSETLYALHGLYDSSVSVERAEFATFTQEARARHRAIVAIAWIPRVTATELVRFEASVRAEGVAGYAVSSRRADGAFVEIGHGARDARDRFPILYVEPMTGNEALLGYDVSDDAERWPAFLATTESGRPTASAPVTLHAPKAGGLGAVVALGVHAHGASADAAPIGYVALSFEFRDVLEEVSRHCRHDSASCLSLSWADTPVAGAARLVVPPEDDAPGDMPTFSAEHRLAFAGREYTLHACPTRAFLAAHRDTSSLLIAAIALAVWELVGLVLYVLARSWRAGAIARQAHTVDLVLQSLAEGVVMVDGDRRVQVANGAALRMLGATLDEIRSEGWGERCPMQPWDGRPPPPVDAAPVARTARGEVFPEEEMRIPRAEGDPLRVAVSARPLADDEAGTAGGVMVLRDVTAQRRSEDEVREHAVEMRLAFEVQKGLYPHAAPAWPGFDVAGDVLPAVGTAGDYYDRFDLADGSHVLAIGDVAGHGLGPAIVMAETRAYLRSLALAGFDLADILGRINARLVEDLLPGMFVSLLVVVIDPATGATSCANAGHTPGLLLDAAGAEKGRCAPTGPALGLFPDARFEWKQGPSMAPGDVLVLMTDGVTESPRSDGELFDEDGVRAAVARRPGLGAQAILEGIQHDLLEAAGCPQRRDDVTLVVCKATGT